MRSYGYDNSVMISCLGYLQMPLPSATRSSRSTARSTMVCASMTMWNEQCLFVADDVVVSPAFARRLMKKRALLGYMQNEKATRPRERQPPRVCVSFCSGVLSPEVRVVDRTEG
jgi:hypothetical protein